MGFWRSREEGQPRFAAYWMKEWLVGLSDSRLVLPLYMAGILFAAHMSVRVLRKALDKRLPGSGLLLWHILVNIASAGIYMIAILVCIGLVPSLGSAFKTLLAGSGILAVGLSLAAQESIGNLVSGLFIAVFRPFEIGDRVTIVDKGITGIVEDITLRHTVIRTFVNNRVVVPNSVMNKEVVENSDLVDSRASSFVDVLVSYESDVDRAMAILAGAVGSHARYIDPRPEDERDGPAVKVYVRELGGDGIWLRASMWTKTVSENFEACSDVRLAVLKRFAEEGIEIPYHKIHLVGDGA